jgi:hypothetical protein
MNILQICQVVCYECNIPAPSAIVASTDPSVLQLRYLYLAVGEELVSRRCWSFLKKTHSFTTSSGDGAYALPSDFYSSILDTQWDRTDRWRMRGEFSDSAWNERLYGYAYVNNITAFRIFGLPSSDQFQVNPTPGTTTLTLSFDYISNAWVRSNSDTYSNAVAADTDSSVFSDRLMKLGLKMKFFESKGWEYSKILNDYEAQINVEAGRFFKSNRISSEGRLLAYSGLNPNIPDGSWSI